MPQLGLQASFLTSWAESICTGLYLVAQAVRPSAAAGSGQAITYVTALQTAAETGSEDSSLAVYRIDHHRSGKQSGDRQGTRGDSEALWDWNLESDRIHFSPRWIALIGCDDHEVGSTPEEWFQRVHPDDHARNCCARSSRRGPATRRRSRVGTGCATKTALSLDVVPRHGRAR